MCFNGTLIQKNSSRFNKWDRILFKSGLAHAWPEQLKNANCFQKSWLVTNPESFFLRKCRPPSFGWPSCKRKWHSGVKAKFLDWFQRQFFLIWAVNDSWDSLVSLPKSNWKLELCLFDTTSFGNCAKHISLFFSPARRQLALPSKCPSFGENHRNFAMAELRSLDSCDTSLWVEFSTTRPQRPAQAHFT